MRLTRILDIRYELRDHVAWVTMSRPDVLNALSKGMFEGLKSGLEKATSDGQVWFVAITGEGSAFSAGLDIKEVGGFGSRGEARRFVYELVKPFWTALFQCDKPVISVVNGPAYGAGAEIPLASDIVVASDTSRFAFSGGRVGALCCISGAIGPLVVHGRSIVELNLTGRSVSAKAAEKMGLVNYTVPKSKLVQTTQGILEDMLRVSPVSNASFKRIRRETIPRKGLQKAYRELLNTITSPDFRKGSTAFARKEMPTYYT